MTLEQRIRGAMTVADALGLGRTLRAPSGIDLCSNDYLGLSSHPLVLERMAEGVRTEGAGSTGSRLLRGERESFRAIERSFAGFKRAERAIYFSSGYLANIAVLSTLTQAGDVIFSDELNHASLIDGARLSKARRVIFPHLDVAALRETLGKVDGQKFVVTESLFSMDGDFAPLRAYAELCREHRATLIVDEAHAVGVCGARGSGCLEAEGIEHESVISINAAGKALGVAGAFVCGPDWAIEYLVQRARPFVFSTAAPPCMAGAIGAALHIVETEPERREYVQALAGRLNSASQIVPYRLGENERAVMVAETLQREGFDVRAIRPPTVPEGTARLRISLNTNLTFQILDRFSAALDRAVQDSACVASS